MAKEFVDKVVQDNKVVVFSKTYCPYCTMAKECLSQTGVKFEVIELDERGLSGGGGAAAAIDLAWTKSVLSVCIDVHDHAVLQEMAMPSRTT